MTLSIFVKLGFFVHFGITDRLAMAQACVCIASIGAMVSGMNFGVGLRELASCLVVAALSLSHRATPTSLAVTIFVMGTAAKWPSFEPQM